MKKKDIKQEDNPPFEVRILWGLPGSGKTTYAHECVEKHHGAFIVDVDSLQMYGKPRLLMAVAQRTLQHSRDQLAIIDGLFTTNEAVQKLIEAILKEKQDNHFSCDIVFSVVWWKKDIATCLHNDTGRRNKNSKITIENLPFEAPNQKILTDVKSFTPKEIITKSDAQIFVDEHSNGDSVENYWSRNSKSKRVLKSSQWCLGGTVCGYDGYKATATADPQPTSFREFDELLMKLCPNITFLQYKLIYADAVTTETTSDSDYYGGRKEYAYFQCDLEILYDKLREMNLIE